MHIDAINAVDDLFSSCKQNYNLLLEMKEISFATEYKSQFAKVVLLACASYFESKVTHVVLETLNTNECSLTYSFISKKALSRQYHTLFDWKKKNANNFFGLFGEDFKNFMKGKVSSDDCLAESINDFLELGFLRNQLAHDNYATFVLNLTVEDIQEKFKSAQRFVTSINPLANEYRNMLSQKLEKANKQLDTHEFDRKRSVRNS